MDWNKMIKDGYDPILSMYPNTLFARQNGKSMTDFKKLYDYLYNQRLHEMSKTSIPIETIDKVYRHIAKDVVRPLRAKGTDGLRAKVTLIDEWNEYCRHDIDVINKTIIKNKKGNNTMRKIPVIKNVIFNEPATIVFWSDDTKTIVKCHNEKFDPEKGLAMAIAKKALGNEPDYYGKNFEKWVGGQLKKEELKPESATLQIGDRAVKVKTDGYDNYTVGDICEIVEPGISKDSVLAKCVSRGYHFKSQYMRKNALRKLAKDQTMRPGDLVVVVKEPSLGCRYAIGDIVKVEDSSKGNGDYNVIGCVRLSDNRRQGFKSIEAVKIVDDTPKAEPEKPKRMTFREEVKRDEPDRINDRYVGGVCGCPKDRPLEGLDAACDLRKVALKGPISREKRDEICRKCWDREIQEEKPAEDSVLRKGDKAVKVNGPNAHVDNHNLGTVVEVDCAEPRPTYSVITKGPVRWGMIETQITYLDSLRKLAKDQTLRVGDKAVVVKKGDYYTSCEVGDIVEILDFNHYRGSVYIRRDRDGAKQQLMPKDLVKIVK